MRKIIVLMAIFLAWVVGVFFFPRRALAAAANCSAATPINLAPRGNMGLIPHFTAAPFTLVWQDGGGYLPTTSYRIQLFEYDRSYGNGKQLVDIYTPQTFYLDNYGQFKYNQLYHFRVAGQRLIFGDHGGVWVCDDSSWNDAYFYFIPPTR